jgi:hypothetical protein
MCDTYLLRSENGRGLPVEVVLRIVEFVIGEEPKCVGRMMRLSKVRLDSILQQFFGAYCDVIAWCCVCVGENESSMLISILLVRHSTG